MLDTEVEKQSKGDGTYRIHMSRATELRIIDSFLKSEGIIGTNVECVRTFQTKYEDGSSWFDYKDVDNA